MCILILKKAGYSLPSKDRLKTCYNNNDDGAGYAYSDGHAVHIKKGFFNFEDFYNELRADYKKHDLKKAAVLLHFRIATSGGVNERKTHPFILSNKSKEVNRYAKEVITSSPVVGHNGVFTGYVYGGLSDTQNFIKDFLHGVYNSNLSDNLKNYLIKKEIGSSKLLILEPSGHVKKYGDFIEDGGALYSNTSYKDRYYYTAPAAAPKYSNLYDGYNWDDWDGFKEYSIEDDEPTDKKPAASPALNYIKKHYTKLNGRTIYASGEYFDKYEGFEYYLNETTGEIYETSDQYGSASYIGNAYQ